MGKIYDRVLYIIVKIKKIDVFKFFFKLLI